MAQFLLGMLAGGVLSFGIYVILGVLSTSRAESRDSQPLQKKKPDRQDPGT